MFLYISCNDDTATDPIQAPRMTSSKEIQHDPESHPCPEQDDIGDDLGSGSLVGKASLLSFAQSNLLPARGRFPATYALVDFFAMDRNLARGIDSDPNLPATRKPQPATEGATSERHDDLIADPQRLTYHHGDQIPLAATMAPTQGTDWHVGVVGDGDVRGHGQRDREMRAQLGLDRQTHAVADADAFADAASQNQHGTINPRVDGDDGGDAAALDAR
jgi:hypothetical protein